MKLHRLELEGFGPFRERQVVDFDAFADDGIFLITGRTGAGKSSVLDGVCFALFGGVPRYDTGDRRLRSDHSEPDDPSSVRLEFSAAGEHWRVTRSPEYERPKRRGPGVTKELHRAVLERRVGDQWHGVAARPVDVAAELEQIVGLTQQQFLQVILLAQNRFARFLLARNDDRQAVLRTLFGTRTYAEYERILDERRRGADAELSTAGETVRLLLAEGERMADEARLRGESASADADIPARVEALVRAGERAAYQAEAAAQEVRVAEAAHDAAADAERVASARYDQQRRRADARAALAAEEAQADARRVDRETLARAVAAEALRAPLEALTRADDAVRAARAGEDDAAAHWCAVGERAETSDDIRHRDEELVAVLAVTASAAGDERELLEAETERAAADAAADAADVARAEVDERRAGVPAAREKLDARAADLAAAPAMLEAARLADVEAAARAVAAREAEEAADVVAAAESTVIAAAGELVAATTAHTDLLQRRLASAAGDLAASLVDGEACAVCGALEHPHPARSSSESVTDESIDAAAERKDAAVEADRVAALAARTARSAHAAAAARAAGRSRARAEAEAADARDAVRRAEAAVAEAEKVARERAELSALDAEAAAAREALVADVARHRQVAALAGQRAESCRTRVAAARADFESVTARADDARMRRVRARALLDARADLEVRLVAARDAGADLVARMETSGFADATAVRDALLAENERTRLDETIREHEAALRAHRQTLFELELALVDAPDEPVDLAPVTAAAAAARDRLTAAASAHATASETARRLRDVAERVDDAHRAIADLAARAAVVSRLADSVAGRAPNTRRMTLETFVLAAELEEIVRAANLRLEEMSAGRYRLQHSDALAARGAASGLGLDVLDAFTGQARPPQSLSGGETFLASLALALGRGGGGPAPPGGLGRGPPLLDEGFGSLDADTLELAMRALDELRQGGRTIGVISHVAAMKEQIPAQLAVDATPFGPSVIRQGAAITA